MESTLSAFKRPSNGFGENNALPLRELHQERKKNKQMVYSSKEHWTHSEDLKLKELVAVYGPRKWKFIGEKMQTRKGTSCRLRWFNQLDPRINQRDFTDEEEEKLLTAHKLFGNKWSKIAKLLNGRTDNGVKNHWKLLMNRIIKRQSTFNIRFFANILNRHTSNLAPGSVSDEGTEIKSYSCNMPYEETTNLSAQDSQEENDSSSMPVQHSGHHHHVSTSLALFTPHVSISQASSSSSSPSSLASSEAEKTMTRKTPRFIDFLGIGDS